MLLKPSYSLKIKVKKCKVTKLSSIKYIHDISDHFNELEKRVRKVRFARIEAAKRMKFKHSVYNTIISLYSILITVIAIVFSTVDFTNLKILDNVVGELFKYQLTSVIILALSSFITMFTLFISNKGYGEKAAKYQSNYMELTRLLADIQNLMVYYQLQNNDTFNDFKNTWISDPKTKTKNLEKRLAKKYKAFADKYAALLTQSENHEDIDYKKACLDEIDDYIYEIETEKIKNADIYVKYNRAIKKRRALNKKICFYKIRTAAKFIFISLLPITLYLIIIYLLSSLNNNNLPNLPLLQAI